MQIAYCLKDNQEYSLWLPDAHEKVMGSLKWGKFEEFFIKSKKMENLSGE